MLRLRISNKEHWTCFKTRPKEHLYFSDGQAWTAILSAKISPREHAVRCLVKSAVPTWRQIVVLRVQEEVPLIDHWWSPPILWYILQSGTELNTLFNARNPYSKNKICLIRFLPSYTVNANLNEIYPPFQCAIPPGRSDQASSAKLSVVQLSYSGCVVIGWCRVIERYVLIWNI